MAEKTFEEKLDLLESISFWKNTETGAEVKVTSVEGDFVEFEDMGYDITASFSLSFFLDKFEPII